jgi:hypothetical protein
MGSHLEKTMCYASLQPGAAFGPPDTFINREYPNAWTNFRSEFPTFKHGKRVHITV